MSEDPIPTPGAARRVWMVLGFVVIALVLAAASIRVFIPPISPGQAAPAGHFPGSCGACHMIVKSVETIDVVE